MPKPSTLKVKKQLNELLKEIEKLKKAHAKLAKTLEDLESEPKATIGTTASIYMKD